MSFEGTTHCLCENGHHYMYNCYDLPIEKCPYCKAPTAWEAMEDETNGYNDEDPIHTLYQFIKTVAVTEECHIVSIKTGIKRGTTIFELERETYNIPTTFGHRV